MTLTLEREKYRRSLSWESGGDKTTRLLLSLGCDGDKSFRQTLSSVRGCIFAVFDGDWVLVNRIWFGGRFPIGSDVDPKNCAGGWHAQSGGLIHISAGGDVCGGFCADGGNLVWATDDVVRCPDGFAGSRSALGLGCDWIWFCGDAKDPDLDGGAGVAILGWSEMTARDWDEEGFVSPADTAMACPAGWQLAESVHCHGSAGKLLSPRSGWMASVGVRNGREDDVDPSVLGSNAVGGDCGVFPSTGVGDGATGGCWLEGHLWAHWARALVYPTLWACSWCCWALNWLVALRFGQTGLGFQVGWITLLLGGWMDWVSMAHSAV
ncbi:uncharacterized protein LOC133739695 [Rosa rugosa]|uniref:uncharacterized protein LOC133739695 n=1 Tax=Rosa rugosa TaxID=74645 RepID=UPI002B4021EA|nr:uncharacterized protein LOC133739695 [Rosa rugosa]